LLALQPADGALDSKYSTTSMQDNEMPLDEDSGVTQFSTLNEMPLDNHLLAEKPGAGGAPPDGANLERQDQVKTTEEGDTLDCGRDKVWQVWDPSDSFRR